MLKFEGVMAILLFSIVLLHLLGGLAWVVYKIEFKPNSKNHKI